MIVITARRYCFCRRLFVCLSTTLRKKLCTDFGEIFTEVSGAGLAWVDTRGPTRLPARAGFF